LPNTIRTIGFGTFADCLQLQWIQLPYDLKRLEASMFANCTQLTTITTLKKTMKNNATTTTSNSLHRRSLMDDDDDDEEDDGTIQLPSKLLSIGALQPTD
jgi:BspA type Leucine rich repeat region (6 copies)